MSDSQLELLFAEERRILRELFGPDIKFHEYILAPAKPSPIVAIFHRDQPDRVIGSAVSYVWHTLRGETH